MNLSGWEILNFPSNIIIYDVYNHKITFILQALLCLIHSAYGICDFLTSSNKHLELPRYSNELLHV